MKQDKIVIVGAGLVGSLLALMLKQKGFHVSVYEKRGDPRGKNVAQGRSINLALSHRGIRPLMQCGVLDKISPILIPMKGRMMHSVENQNTFQPYGQEDQHINSVSRAILNENLIQASEEAGVKFFFDQHCESMDFEDGQVFFSNGTNVKADLIIGADGAFSAVRKQMQLSDRFNYSQHFIEHGYKEFTIEPINDEFALDPNYLHIWPRGNFMLIALPNADKTFTGTLFFPFEGDPSFTKLDAEMETEKFFSKYFPDTLKLIADIDRQYSANPTSSLVTISCDPWNKGKALLIGDAAHAIVPFYGQGMNSGFEDVRLFVDMAEEMEFRWEAVLPRFSNQRKKDADAISELALLNFLEMRDHVGDPKFLERKALEAELQKRYPAEWLPLYSMVTFSDIPYSEALRIGKIQNQVMNEFMESSQDVDYQQIVNRFNSLKTIEPIAYQ